MTIYKPNLSERQREVACLVAQGYSNKDIAEKLCITVDTVKRHIGDIFVEIGVENRVQLAIWAFKNDLVDLDTVNPSVYDIEDDMEKRYTEKRIRSLIKDITIMLNTALAEKLKELFVDVYGDTCKDEYTQILSSLVMIEQEILPVAEMKYKKIGDVDD